MAKTATIGVRVDDDLKQRAQDALDEIGLPMSLSIEMFLRYVADNGRLPFNLGDAGPSPEELKEAERRERDFWKAFMTWYFQVWPMFDSPEHAKQAEEDFGYTGRSAGAIAETYIRGDADGLRAMEGDQTAAYFDVSNMRHLLSEAKELVYWALDMDKTFVPRLAATYSGQLDKWRMAYVKKAARKREGKDGDVIADGVIGARYFADLQ